MYDGDQNRTLGERLEIFSLHQARYEPSSKLDMATSFNSTDNREATSADTNNEPMQSKQEGNSLLKVRKEPSIQNKMIYIAGCLYVGPLRGAAAFTHFRSYFSCVHGAALLW